MHGQLLLGQEAHFMQLSRRQQYREGSTDLKERKDYAVERDCREAHGEPELPFGLSQYTGGRKGGGGRGEEQCRPALW